MTTNRTRRPRRPRGDRSPIAWRYMSGLPIDEIALNETESLELLCLKSNTYQHDKQTDTEQLWRRNAPAILAGWAIAHPGTRPELWWRFDAPEPRRRLGGVGDVASDRLAIKPEFSFGIPTTWVGPIFKRWYPRLRLKIPDPKNLPLYESESTYLDRLNLLADTEREALPPAALDPVRYQPDTEQMI